MVPPSPPNMYYMTYKINLCSYNNRTFQVAGMKAICKEDQLSQLLYGELEKAIKKQGDLMLKLHV